MLAQFADVFHEEMELLTSPKCAHTVSTKEIAADIERQLSKQLKSIITDYKNGYFYHQRNKQAGIKLKLLVNQYLKIVGKTESPQFLLSIVQDTIETDYKRLKENRLVKGNFVERMVELCKNVTKEISTTDNFCNAFTSLVDHCCKMTEHFHQHSHY